MQQIACLKKRFLSPTFFKIRRSYAKIMCICYFIGSVVKIALYLHFLYTNFDRLKRNTNDKTIIFLTSLLGILNWKNILVFSFWYKIISCFDHDIWNNEKKKIQAVLTLLTDVNLKNLYSFFCDDAIPLQNFRYRKKIVPLLTKDFFSRSFQLYFFYERVCCVKDGRQFHRIKYLKWLNRSKKSSIVDIQLGSKYASVNITLQGFT